jgi:TolA-binding protein
VKAIIIGLSMIVATSALAQQTPDPAFLQRAIGVLQTQRNTAMDAQVVTEAKVAELTEELAKAQARIKELEAKAEEKKQ